MKRLTTLLIGTCLVSAPAFAQDGGLYPEPSSPDASFLRVLDVENDGARIDGSDVDMNDAGFSPYIEVQPGTVGLDIGDDTSEFEVGANTHYTVIADEGETTLTEDAVEDSPAQADLLLYNLGDLESFELYAVEAETAAMADVAPGAHSGVALKAPLTLTFELRQDGETLASLDPVTLERGTGSTVVVTGNAESAELGVAKSTYSD
ncbi:alginate O-acetyltransferase AlgF [Maritimibacter sp. UBA3975]|uniref:alginate O-acetyltransferase AlgF n=1 Tax=Maritimibacter sp. UBA3975 TaxID=1946833 RepID=UPI0025C5666B|nr:alginate O-acetyltransferase AlgF [Maritimibacter sp. UBA3975]|tara:strand:+ start:10791 stop:11408 length:618 start_codon:yes stop_codon:yes gene_type:complete